MSSLGPKTRGGPPSSPQGSSRPARPGFLTWLADLFSPPDDEPLADALGQAPQTLSPEVLKRVRGIHLRTRHMVDEVMGGEYLSAFKGQGMEFEEVREYQPGDDIRAIDWNVTARTGHPYVKTFREERELTVMLLVDVSASGRFGSSTRAKNEVAAEVAALLAYTAIRNHDKVGLLLFTDTVERYIPPRKGRGHVWRVIREILSFRPAHTRTDLASALDFLNRVHRKKSICFVISDFLDEGYQRPLRLTGKVHDVIALSIVDPREQALPAVGFLELEDAETGDTLLVDTGDPRFLKRFASEAKVRERAREESFRAMKLDHIPLRSDEDLIHPLLRYFRMRERRA